MAECEKVAKYRRHLQKRQAFDAELQNYKNRNSVLYIPLNKPRTKKCHHDRSDGALVGLTQVGILKVKYSTLQSNYTSSDTRLDERDG